MSPVRLLALGDTAWTVEFGERIDPAVHALVLGFARALEARQQDAAFGGILDVVPTFRSVTVHYDPLACDGERLGVALLGLAQSSGEGSARGRQWLIPVCFDDDLAPDLAALAQAKNLGRDDVIQRMIAATFQVYMIGFMPGFPYMGGLPVELQMPRLASPRKAVPARSLAVAGEMCAVYPWESPGGWRLLGRTPIPMFSVADPHSPSLLTSGDHVRWRAIERAEYVELETAASAGELDRESFLVVEAG